MKKEKLQIKLGEIPEEGKTYSYSNQSGELNLGLKDLIDESPYQISFTIRPMGNVYEVKGDLKTSFPRICSKCGWEIEIPVASPIAEIVLPKSQDDKDKGDTQSKSGFIGDEDSELAVTYVKGGVLDAESMLHEVLAVKEPLYPSCEKTDCEHLKDAQAKLAQLQKEAEEALHSETKNPFSTLKGLKF